MGVTEPTAVLGSAIDEVDDVDGSDAPDLVPHADRKGEYEQSSDDDIWQSNNDHRTDSFRKPDDIQAMSASDQQALALQLLLKKGRR